MHQNECQFDRKSKFSINAFYNAIEDQLHLINAVTIKGFFFYSIPIGIEPHKDTATT